MTQTTPREWTVTVYKSGNSKVITLPAKTRAKIGDTYTLKEDKKHLSLHKKTSINATQKAKLAKLHRLIGNLPGLTKDFDDIDKLETFLEGVYE
jgi:hypothetical protein